MPELTPVETDRNGIAWYAEPPIEQGLISLCPQCGSRVEIQHTTDRAYVGATPTSARCFDCNWRWQE